MLKRIASLMCLTLSLYAETDLWLGVGYREDSLSWSIAGPKGEPNVLSELEWNDIQMLDFELALTGTISKDWFYRLSADYGTVTSGKNIDSDYFGNDRTILFSKSENDAGKGNAFDVNVALGYPLNAGCLGLSVIPIVGYSYQHQHFCMRNGNQVVDAIHGYVGPIEGLDSSYKTRWSSGVLGLDFLYEPYQNFSVFGELAYLFTSYEGRGHWNLRQDLLGDFKHEGNGNGVNLAVGTKYEISCGMGLGLFLDYKFLKVEGGKDRTKFLEPQFDSSGNIVSETPAVGELRLNEVKWHSFRLIGLIDYAF